MPKPCGFSDRNLAVLDSHTTRIALRYVDTPSRKPLRKVYQTRGMRSIPQHALPRRDSGGVTLGVHLRFHISCKKYSFNLEKRLDLIHDFYRYLALGS